MIDTPEVKHLLSEFERVTSKPEVKSLAKDVAQAFGASAEDLRRANELTRQIAALQVELDSVPDLTAERRVVKEREIEELREQRRDIGRSARQFPEELKRRFPDVFK